MTWIYHQLLMNVPGGDNLMKMAKCTGAFDMCDI